MDDGSKANDAGSTPDEPETRVQRLHRRSREAQIRQHVARGLAYGVGSGAVSLLVLWMQTGGMGR